MNNEMHPGRFGDLTPKQIANCWCWFCNDEGSYSIAWCCPSFSSDDYYESGAVFAVVDDYFLARNLVYYHNIGILGVCVGTEPERTVVGEGGWYFNRSWA